ncbi:MAG: response regulator transcription factor [Saprospiraceae bacterium]
MQSVSILIVEDDIFISQHLREQLKKMDYEVAGVAYNAQGALDQLAKHRPDLVLLDINLGEGKDGIDVAEIIREEYQIPFIYLTSYANRSIIERAKPSRPAAYIVKPFTEKDLFANIEIALYNHAQGWQVGSWEPDIINKRFDTEFTRKEVALLRDVFEGKTNRQICEKHFVSLNTVKSHILRIYAKLDVHSRSEAMAELRKRLAQ